MKSKLYLIFFIFYFLIIGILNKAHAQYYSIQVKSFPSSEKSDALKFYNKLKKNGYFVYLHKTKIKKEWWIRIKLGYFNTKEKADDFGKEIKSKSNLDYWLNTANVLVDKSNSNYTILTTPSGIWLEKISMYEEVYTFLPQLFHAGVLMETKALASPVSDEIVFYFQKQLIKVDLKSKSSFILKKAQIIEELNCSSPKWSFDGKYIAYMDSYTWEVPTRLWIMSNDGTQDTCIIQDLSHNNKVKDFGWHPLKNILYYIFGYTWGSNDSGGNLYSFDLKSLKSRLITTTDNLYRIEKLNVDKDGIILKIMQFEQGSPSPLEERLYKKIPFPKDSDLIKLTNEDFK